MQSVEIARLLGWTDKRGRSDDKANACHAALTLIRAGHLDREDLDGINVSAARALVQRVKSRHEQIEKIAKTKGVTPAETRKAKTQVAKAA